MEAGRIVKTLTDGDVFVQKLFFDGFAWSSKMACVSDGRLGLAGAWRNLCSVELCSPESMLRFQVNECTSFVW